MNKKEIKTILEEYIKLCNLTITDYRKMIDNIEDPAAKIAFKTRIFQINLQMPIKLTTSCRGKLTTDFSGEDFKIYDLF